MNLGLLVYVLVELLTEVFTETAFVVRFVYLKHLLEGQTEK